MYGRWVTVRLLPKYLYRNIYRIGFFYSFNGSRDGEEPRGNRGINTITKLIEEVYPNFLDLGYTPSFFWDLSLQDIYDLIESKHRLRKFEAEKENYELKTQLIANSVLARQIAENVACIFSKDAKVTDIYELMPELFAKEREEAQKKVAENQWKLHKARFMAFSEEHNNKRKEEEKCQQ